MQKNILITGKPKSGKSVLLKKLMSNIPNKVGFLTNEILRDGKRVGFETETHTGQKAVLAHIDFKTSERVGKFFVNAKDLDLLFPHVKSFHKGDVLYIDEIGEMQLFSEKFKELVLRFLGSDNTCIMTLSSVYEDDFIKEIKKRDDIFLVEITSENREEKEQFITQLLRKIEKAKKYISEPQRFSQNGNEIILKSEHGVRKLIFKNGLWSCSCDFFKQYAICSHMIAVTELNR